LESKIAKRDGTIGDLKTEIKTLYQMIANLNQEKAKLQKALAEHDAKVKNIIDENALSRLKIADL